MTLNICFAIVLAEREIPRDLLELEAWLTNAETTLKSLSKPKLRGPARSSLRVRNRISGRSSS